MSAKKPTGLTTSQRFSGTVTRLSTSTSIPFDILQYGVPAEFPEPNASFTISLMDGNTDVVAPYGAVFRATGFTGFNVSEPAGDDNVYDPTQHKITIIWDFDDAAYTPVTVPNIPTVWRNLNLGYGKQVAHVWHSGGERTVSVFAFDDAGNWATATRTVNITAADTFYSGTNTIVWSQAGNFAGAPAGATQCTTIAEVHTALRALLTAGGNNRVYRILFRAGETFDDVAFFRMSGTGSGYPGGTSYDYGTIRGILFGSFGSGARPVILHKRNSFGTPFSFPGNVPASRQWIFSDIEFKGDWDATKETGHVQDMVSVRTLDGLVLFTRCKQEGHEGSSFFDRVDGDVRFSILHDTDVTGWNNYGVSAADAPRQAFLGCDIHQKTDALGGINQGGSRREPWSLGNIHGPYRCNAGAYDTIFSCTSFFSKNGWSNNNADWNTRAPTAEQPPLRFHAHFSTGGSNSRRHSHVFDRCSLEGGSGPIAIVGVSGSPPSNFVELNPKNVVIDKCLFVSSGATGPSENGTALLGSLAGTTIRNCYFYRHSVSPSFGLREEIRITFSSNGTLAGCGPVEIYNNTFINELPSERFNAAYTPINVAAGHTVLIENNVIRAVNRPPFQGTAFLPLGTSALAGFTCRYAGTRWNFPPVASTLNVANNTWTAVSRREEPGNPGVLQPGDVANLEWMFLPYPDWTGRCQGAGDVLGVLSAAEITANSTQKHVVSITGVDTKRMGDSALWSGADGRVAFDFHPAGIRVQNRTGATLTSASGTIVVLLDMSDYLMPLDATFSTATTIPDAVPLAGSSALGTASGLVAQFDGLGGTRPGKITNTGTFVPGTASQGWIEPS